MSTSNITRFERFQAYCLGNPKYKPATPLPQLKGMFESHSTSELIRTLGAEAIPVAEIARILDVKYQHVRNVLTRPLKRQIKAERLAKQSAIPNNHD